MQVVFVFINCLFEVGGTIYLISLNWSAASRTFSYSNESKKSCYEPENRPECAHCCTCIENIINVARDRTLFLEEEGIDEKDAHSHCKNDYPGFEDISGHCQLLSAQLEDESYQEKEKGDNHNDDQAQYSYLEISPLLLGHTTSFYNIGSFLSKNQSYALMSSIPV